MERFNEDLIRYPLSVGSPIPLGEILEEHYGAELAYTIAKEGDLDVILLKRRSLLDSF